MQVLDPAPVDIATLPLEDDDAAMAISVATLEERVNNYIKFFWTVVAFGFVWLAGLTGFMLHINDTLNRIEKAQTSKLGILNQSVAELRGDLSPLQLNAQASLPNDSFQKTLPKLKTVLAAANKEQVPVSPKVMSELQQKLLDTNSEAPDYWPVVSEFISYRSASTVSAVLSNLPHCTDHEPSEARVAADPGTPLPEGPVGIIPSVYEKCQLSLDSPVDTTKINSLIINRSPYLRFRHCLITYHGGRST